MRYGHGSDDFVMVLPRFTILIFTGYLLSGRSGYFVAALLLGCLWWHFNQIGARVRTLDPGVGVLENLNLHWRLP